MNPIYFSSKFFTKKQVKNIVATLIISVSWNMLGSAYSTPFIKVAKASELEPSELVWYNNTEITSSSPDMIVTSTQPIKNTDTTDYSDLKAVNSDDNDDIPKTETKIRKIKSTKLMNVSAYNVGDIYQCDGDPCTSANGENICLALERGYKRCAANFVPFGTILNIEGYGDCVVTDRMNSRYQNHVDIAMAKDQKQIALKFGRKNLKVSIIEMKELESKLASR